MMAESDELHRSGQSINNPWKLIFIQSDRKTRQLRRLHAHSPLGEGDESTGSKREKTLADHIKRRLF